MPISKDRQYRQMTMQIRKSEEPEKKSFIVEGYATTWDRYLLFDAEKEEDRIYEQFSKECFKKCDLSDVIFQYNHEGKVFARISNKTLEVKPDDHGLWICADLGTTETARQMFEEIDTGLVTKMSWGFIPLEYKFDAKTRTIIHTSVKKVYDVSAVSFPANDTTEISARSFCDGEIEKALREIQEVRKQQLLLELKLKLAN